ncbi:MAG: glycosyltransferase family 4 protein [Gammaproteobacteria bacterium]|nr:glycosyltransferase family 4 protein [Gammaproteobacteria bacterium]MCP5136682.1 glycosyltransferase family 4 protein [Gammaproteobacteria bacterium]
MRVLHVNAKAGFFGGVERILFDTANGLQERGWPQALLHAEATVQEAYRGPFAEIASDEALIDRFQPDVILIHKESDADRITRLAARLPTVRMVHDHDLVCLRRHKYFPSNTRICERPAGIDCYTHLCFVQRGERFPIALRGLGEIRRGLAAHAQVRGFIAISQWMRAELAMNGIDAKRIHDIHPIPSALDRVTPLPPASRPEILFVGQVIRGKGVDLMIRALAELTGDWHATVVGDGHHLPECRALAAELGLAERIHFTGWIDHEALQDYYAQALFTVVPSRWPEPFGMVGVEAMARARAVVAFAAGGIPDWLDHGQTGLLVPPADVKGMGQAMQELLDTPERAAELGRRGAQTVAERFRHGAYLDQIAHLLESIA